MIPHKKEINLEILHASGYFKRHFELCQSEKTQQDAFDVLEDEYVILTKKHKYTSYEAFRAAKSRYYNNRLNR
jgi:hypothetical protein